MPLDFNGLLQAYNLGVESYVPLDAYIREVYTPEAPLLTRLPRVMAESESYNIITYDVRPNDYTINATITNNATSMTLVDATPLQPGDVLEMTKTDGSAIERMEVVGQANTDGLIVGTLDGVTINVRRAREGTTGVANDAAAFPTIRLIGNSRTGAEVNQGGVRSIRTAIPQDVQTYQFSITLGGKAQAVRTVALPSGVSDLFGLETKTRMLEFARNVENGFYHGLGERPVATGDRAKQKGLKKLIGYYRSGANVKVNAGGSYTLNGLFGDTIQRAVDGGGNPDLLLVSTNFLSFIKTWTAGSQFFMDPEYNELGVSIGSFRSSFIGQPMKIQSCYQLRPGTAICCTSTDLRVRYLRNEMLVQRGVIGDATLADIIGDFCIELGHPGWHAWVEGITGAA